MLGGPWLDGSLFSAPVPLELDAPPPGLVGAWHFANGLTDLSGRQNHASTISLGSDLFPTVTERGPGMRSLGGSAGCLPVGSGSSLQAQTFTLIFWAGTTDTAGNRAIYGGGTTVAAAGMPELRISGGTLTLLKQNVANIGSASLSGMSLGGVIHQLAVTYSSPNAIFYLDGVQIGTASSAQTFTYTDQMTIGGARTGAGLENWLGSILGGKIYNRVLSAAEIAADFRDPKAIYRPQAGALGSFLGLSSGVVAGGGVRRRPFLIMVH